MEYEFIIKEQICKVLIEAKENHFFVDLGNKKIEVESSVVSPNCLSLLIGDESFTVYWAEKEGKRYFSIGGEEFLIQEAEESKGVRGIAEADGMEAKGTVSPPMPGKVLKILVKKGDKVRKNQSLAIVEAMKMEHEVKAPCEAVVKKVNFSQDDMVDTEDSLIELEIPDNKKE
ncbi:MAG: acetyl-CoA carboxylase biotin carboxyl carrier protein subunit [Candidatus Zixiibacteriota bacterium]